MTEQLSMHACTHTHTSTLKMAKLDFKCSRTKSGTTITTICNHFAMVRWLAFEWGFHLLLAAFSWEHSKCLRTESIIIIIILTAHTLSCSVVTNALWPREPSPARLLHPLESPGEKTEVGCHFLLQGIFPSQGLNPHLLHWQANSLPLSQRWSPPLNNWDHGAGCLRI